MNKSIKIAIMQPTYLPWIGYFALMNYVDKFVILDNVQFNKRSWQQRNKILSASGPIWLSVPVFSKNNNLQLINEVQIDQMRNFYNKHLKAIKLNYTKSQYFDMYFYQLEKIFSSDYKYLIDLNLSLIKWIKDILNIKTKLILSSKMRSIGKREHLLLNICIEEGSNFYVSPLGSKIYLEKTNIFKENNIYIQYFNYIPKKYVQVYSNNDYFLSIIDMILNIGPQSIEFLKYE